MGTAQAGDDGDIWLRIRLANGEWLMGWHHFLSGTTVTVGHSPDADIRVPDSGDEYVSRLAFRLGPAGGTDWKVVVVNRNGANLINRVGRESRRESNERAILQDGDRLVVQGSMLTPIWELHIRLAGEANRSAAGMDHTGETFEVNIDREKKLWPDDVDMLTAIAVHAIRSTNPVRAILPNGPEVAQMFNILHPDRPIGTQRQRVNDRLQKLQIRVAEAVFPKAADQAPAVFIRQYPARDVIERLSLWMWTSGFFAQLQSSQERRERADIMAATLKPEAQTP